mgnify:CR=1 FL=1
MKKNNRQFTAPISKAMEAYAGDGALAFHTPGHKQGLGAHPLLRRLITEAGLRQEVSLMEELDDLHEPAGCIKEAQELAAELWGAKESLFVINGTTGAIQAMLVGTLSPGDKVLVPRNAHRSIMGGIILAGAVPIYIQPEIDTRLGIAMGLSVATVQQAIKEHPEAKALVAVYPTYYGFCCDLQRIGELVHEANMLLLVDEAHGAHLRFGKDLPKQAIELGADVAAQSTHKLLGSMTQTSMLHIGSNRVEAERIRQAASLLQSTSPNQLLLASLDIARLQMAQEGAQRVNRAVELAQWLRKKINAIPGLYCPGKEIWAGQEAGQLMAGSGDLSDVGAVALDWAKVTVNLAGLDISGQEAELLLRHQWKVQCELSDPENLLFIISMADTQREADRLLQVLQELAVKHLATKTANKADSDIAEEQACKKADNLCNMAEMPVAVPRMNPREAFFAPIRTVALEKAIGCICGETIAFYPPGIPVLCPGEEITEALVEYIRFYQAKGMRLSGAVDSELKTIRVCQEAGIQD